MSKDPTPKLDQLRAMRELRHKGRAPVTAPRSTSPREASRAVATDFQKVKPASPMDGYTTPKPAKGKKKAKKR